MSYFLDTNLLVYSVDDRDPEKKRRAREVMERLVVLGVGVLSTQVLAEFATVSLRKLGWSPDQSKREIERTELVFSVLPLTAAVVLEALRGVEEHLFSFYDAQIWAVAKLSHVPTILSEDFGSGSTIEGIRFENPLDPAFELSSLT